MKTLLEHIDDLDRMIDGGNAPKHEIRSQIAFIGREVSALITENARMIDENAKLTAAHAQFENAQNAKPPDSPNFGSQPRIKGRMEP